MRITDIDSYDDWKVVFQLINVGTVPTILAQTLADGRFHVTAVAYSQYLEPAIAETRFASKPANYDSDFGSLTKSVTALPRFEV
jgi:hypothetical protein